MPSDWGKLLSFFSLLFSLFSLFLFPFHLIEASSDEETAPAPGPTPAAIQHVIAPKKSKFADEDASDDDDVKDDWDVSESEDDKPKKAPVNPALVGSMRNKGAVKKKIQEKEEAERLRLEEEERKVSFSLLVLACRQS